MTDHRGYEYMDDTQIDDEFKCLICNEPFEKPMCTPCDHTFCLLCIDQWLRKNTDENRSCPICRNPLSIDNDLKPASRIISNRIDRYLVKCLECKLDGIPRGSFSDHISKRCQKANVPCSACNILCPWIGPRYQLDEHLKVCSYQQIRPALESLQAKNSHLEQLLIDQQQQITNITEKCQMQQHQINELITMMKSMKDFNNVLIKKTITFDDLIERNTDLNLYHRLPNNYADFKWRNGAFMPQQHSTSYPSTGFTTALKKDKKCAVFNFGNQAISMTSLRGAFAIVSFEATCAFQDEVTLTVTGRRADRTTQTTTFILRWHKLEIFNLNWNNITELEFLPSGGKQLSTGTDTDRHVILTCLNFG